MRVIAIDPGKHTGLADVTAERLLLEETSFWGAYSYVIEIPAEHVDLVVIEVSPRNQSKVWHDHKGNARKAAKIGQNVGAVRDQGELLAEGLSRAGYRVKTVAPRGKLDAKPFSLLTGYTGTTNPHKRDAGVMAWNEYQRLKQLERISA